MLKENQKPSASAPGKRMRPSDFLVYLLAVMCLGALVLWAGEGGLQRLAKPDWLHLAGALLLTYLSMEAIARRYACVLRLYLRGKAIAHLPILYGTAFGMTAGLIITRGLGQLIAKPAVLRDREGLPMIEGMYASLLERLMDLTTSIILMLPFLLRLALGAESFPGAYLLLYAAVLVTWGLVTVRYFTPMLAGVGNVTKCILSLLERLRFPSLRKFGESLDSAIGPLQTANRGANAVGFVAYTISKLLLMSGRLFLLSHAFSVPISWELLLFGVPVVQLALLFSFTPGSLGFLEAGWLAVLSLQGVPADKILTLLLGLRVINYLFFPFMTLGVWMVYRLAGSERGGKVRRTTPPALADD